MGLRYPKCWMECTYISPLWLLWFVSNSLDPQQWIGTTASGEMQHTSGSYSAVVAGTNLRFVDRFIPPSRNMTADHVYDRIISLNTIYWYKDKWVLHTRIPDFFFYIFRHRHRLSAFGCTTVTPSSKYCVGLVCHSSLHPHSMKARSKWRHSVCSAATASCRRCRSACVDHCSYAAQ